jgi:hypothetical protein
VKPLALEEIKRRALQLKEMNRTHSVETLRLLTVPDGGKMVYIKEELNQLVDHLLKTVDLIQS